MTWLPIDDADLCQSGEPVPAPLGQALVRNHDHTVARRVYQYGARAWLGFLVGGTPVIQGVELATHDQIWLRIVTAFVAPDWVRANPSDWVFRLIVGAVVTDAPVTLYLDSGGYRPMAGDVRHGGNLVQLLTGSHVPAVIDVEASTMLRKPAAAGVYEIAVWALSDSVETQSGLVELTDYYDEGALVGGYPVDTTYATTALLDGCVGDKACLVARITGTGKGEIPPKFDGVRLLVQRVTDEPYRLVLWPPIDRLLEPFIEAGDVGLELFKAGRLSMNALSYEFVPKSML